MCFCHFVLLCAHNSNRYHDIILIQTPKLTFIWQLNFQMLIANEIIYQSNFVPIPLEQLFTFSFPFSDIRKCFRSVFSLAL